jgi:hypothetical protein
VGYVLDVPAVGYDPMKVGDWVTWNGTSNVGRVVSMSCGIVQVRITATHPNKLSETTFTLPYAQEVLTAIPEAIAKIINS